MIPRTLNSQIPIVDSEGRPTRYFMEVIQDTGEDVVSTADDLSAVEAAVAALTSSVSSLAVAVASLALDDLTDVDVTTTPPTNGQVLTFDSGDGLWKPETPSGGGGGGSGYTPPSAADYTLVNDAGVTTLTDEDIGLLLGVGAGGAGTQLRCAMKAAPSTPYSIAWKQRSLAQGAGTDAQGFLIRDSSGGRCMKFGVAVDNNVPSVDLEKWNSVSSYSGNVTSSNAGGYELNYFRYSNDGVTHYFQVGFSKDGPWVTVFSEAIGTFVTTIDQIGWAIEDQVLAQYYLLIEDYEEA